MNKEPGFTWKKPSLFVGICGGSASGKSQLASYLKNRLGKRAVLFSLDWYYRDRSGVDLSSAMEINFDHPSALETPLLDRHLKMLAEGRPIEAPSYDYQTHTRRLETRLIRPAEVVILEGLFVLHDRKVAARLDLSVYIDVPADERLLRRLRRDSAERKVDIEETLRLYERFVRPMHEKFVAPSAPSATWRWAQLEDRQFPARLLREIRARLLQVPTKHPR